MQQYSVLMSVYYKENPACFRAAMESVLNQTVPQDDFVVVCDGPLTTELEGVLAEMIATHPETIQAVRLKENRGIGYAANQGLAACKYDLVAKMDARLYRRPANSTPLAMLLRDAMWKAEPAPCRRFALLHR